MPIKKHSTTWEAAPHTIAKIAILKAYLFAWFQIMGRTKRGQDLFYIDGFAGPGEYTNHPTGSPIATLEAAKAVITSTGAEWKAGNIHCAFIELDPEKFALLKERVEPYQDFPGVKIHLLNSSFVDGLSTLRKQMPAAFERSYPLFVFIDPFGPTHVPFSTVVEILQSGCSEVLINLDADGIARIFKAQESANGAALLDKMLPYSSWRYGLSKDQPFPVLCRQVLSLYKIGLRKLPKVRYVFAFEMQSSGDALSYYLVFASQHPLGLEKMKEAMKRIDQTGEYRFSDARIGQTIMFRFDEPKDFSQLMFRQFAGKKATYPELRDFALNETPFLNPKRMLKILEEAGSIRQVIGTDAKRRKGTFKEETIRYIEFMKGDRDGEEN